MATSGIFGVPPERTWNIARNNTTRAAAEDVGSSLEMRMSTTNIGNAPIAFLCLELDHSPTEIITMAEPSPNKIRPDKAELIFTTLKSAQPNVSHLPAKQLSERSYEH